MRTKTFRMQPNDVSSTYLLLTCHSGCQCLNDSIVGVGMQKKARHRHSHGLRRLKGFGFVLNGI